MFNTELDCYTTVKESIPIHAIEKNEFKLILDTFNYFEQTWITSNGFKAEEGQICLLPDTQGKLSKILLGLGNSPTLWTYAKVFKRLPEGVYHYHKSTLKGILSWGLEAYSLNRSTTISKLNLQSPFQEILSQLRAIYWVRDLINTPANYLGPSELAEATAILGKYGAKIHVITGKALQKNFPAVYAVGKSSHREPCVIDVSWGNPDDMKITLVGKGVCFDSGGLNLKPPANMRLMKKDMGGAAHALGLGRLIISENLPISLRIIVPTVDNLISQNAMMPGDIINTKKGYRVEIDNTDAEGRLILADALTEACLDKPDYLIDFSTLTGAARVALGTDISVFFTNQKSFIKPLIELGEELDDPVWPLPLFAPYSSHLDTYVADFKNSSDHPYAGAILAALFLNRFVDCSNWLHFDLMAWNLKSKPGRPEGGEAMALRTMFHFIKKILAQNER